MSNNSNTKKTNKYGTKIVLTIGGFVIPDSPRFDFEEDALDFIRKNPSWSTCGFRYL